MERPLCRMLLLLAPFVLVVVIYTHSLPKEFTNWDDPKYILDNPLIQTISFQNLQNILATPYFANYAPVTMLSFTLDISLWGTNANAFHLHNVLLHLAALVALYVLLGQFRLGTWPRSLAVLAFAVHPTAVESVSWASERKNLLASLFFLICLSQYLRYTRTSGLGPYLLSLLFFLLSVLSKATTVVTPLILLAYDYLWEGKKAKEIRLMDKAPFFLLTAVQVYVSIRAAGHGAALHSYYGASAWLSLLDSGRLVLEYLKLIFWPAGLTPLITPKLIPSAFDWRVLGPFLVMALVFAVWIRLGSRRSLFWPAFFLLLLAPVMNIVPLPVVMANRYLYLPQIGAWVLLGILLEKLDRISQRRWRPLLLSLVFIGTGALTFQARSWAGAWSNSISLWRDAVRKDSMNLVARANLGHAYLEKGRTREAARQFAAVLGFQRDNVLALTGLAACALAQDDFMKAQSYATQATVSFPEYPLAFQLLGRSRLLQGDLIGAREALVKAYELNPLDNGILSDLVSVYERSTQPLDGTFLADLMIRNSPDSYEGYWARARLLMAGRRYDEATPFLEAAVGHWQKTGRPLDPGIARALGEARAKARKGP